MADVNVALIGGRVDDDDFRHATSEPGAEVSITLSPVTDKLHHLLSVLWSYSDVPSGGGIDIKSPAGETQWSYDITAAGPAWFPLEPMKGSEIVITLKSGGGAVVGKLNIAKITRNSGF